MILSRRVALGGLQLDEIDPSVVIQSVVPGAPRRNTQSVSRMHGIGNRITTEAWNPMETAVRWSINKPKRDIAGRRAVFDAVNAWALRGGWLTTNEMPDRYMFVDRVTLPDGADMWNWTAEYETVFTAYNVPFWQGNLISRGSPVASSLITTDIPVDGNTDTVLDFTFQNASGAKITNMKVNIYYPGSSSIKSVISLDGIELAADGRIVLSHGNDGIMRLTRTQGGVTESILSCMKTESSDDSFISPGDTHIMCTAYRAGILNVSCRGRYL